MSGGSVLDLGKAVAALLGSGACAPIAAVGLILAGATAMAVVAGQRSVSVTHNLLTIDRR